jgi:hypothetical protein
LTLARQAATAAQVVWNAVCAVDPATWVILGLLGIVVILDLLVTHWKKVSDAISTAWGWLTKFGSAKTPMAASGTGFTTAGGYIAGKHTTGW